MLYFYNNRMRRSGRQYTFCTGAIPEQQSAGDAVYDQNFGPKIYTLAADYNSAAECGMDRAMAPILNAEVIKEDFVP